MEVEQPVTYRRTNWLDLPLARVVPLNWATLLLGLVVLLAIGTRFWELGARAMHHDESLHTVYSWYLSSGGHYSHEPLMHGPLLFHLTAFSYWLFGVTDFTARLVPALLGVGLTWFPWKFRSILGQKGALATSFLVLISPSLLYYSRFIREDIFAAMWTAIIVYGLWKYMEGGEDFHLYVMVAGWALLFSQKEISFLLAFVFWTFLALIFALRYVGWLGPKVSTDESREWHLLVLLGALLLPFVTAALLHIPAIMNKALGLSLPILDPGPLVGESERSVYNNASNWPGLFKVRAYVTAGFLLFTGTWVAGRLWNIRKFIGALAVFYTIFILFHTTFFTNPHGIGSGIVGALGYWIEQHEVARGGQPWYYYMMLLPLYEFLPLLFGLVGSGLLLRHRRNRRVAPDPTGEEDGEVFHLDARALWPYFNLWWFLGNFVLFSYAGEKMPWLVIHLTLPIIFLAGWATGRFLDGVDWRTIRERGGLVFAAVFLVATLAFLNILWLIWNGRLPFRGTDEQSIMATARWLLALAFLFGAGWAALEIGDRLKGRAARQVAILAIFALLSLATVRFAVIATYINADTPHEPLIYVQTSPRVTMIVDDLKAMSRRLTGGLEMRVAFDNFSSWPFLWYLRDFPNRVYYGDQPESQAEAIRNAHVVLVGWENEEKVKPLVHGYIRYEYPMRWWFPEDYKNLTDQYVWQPSPEDPNQPQLRLTGEQSSSPANVLRNLWTILKAPSYRNDFLEFFLYRRVQEPLQGENLVVYVKPDLVSEVWQQSNGDPLALSSAQEQDPAAAVTEMEPVRVLSPEEPFGDVKDVAVLPDGRLVVSDVETHTVRIMEPDGTLVEEFGGFGTEAGQFNQPWGVATGPDGTIYVADTWNNRVQRLSQQGEVLDWWGQEGDTGGALGEAGVFWGPRDVAVDEEGKVYVTDTGNKRVQVFDAEGNFLDQFGGAGSALGQLAEPVGVAVGPDGTIWVADTWNRRIQRFSPDFTPLGQLPLQAWSGESAGNKPYIAVGTERVWVSDPEKHRIAELDHDGNLLRTWGAAGSGQTTLNLPYGLAWDGEWLWVADSEQNRIVAYEPGARE